MSGIKAAVTSFVPLSFASRDLDVGVNKNNIMETGYTRSMRARLAGPKDLRRKLYRNLMDKDETKLLLEW
jgi:hypothetical protein